MSQPPPVHLLWVEILVREITLTAYHIEFMRTIGVYTEEEQYDGFSLSFSSSDVAAILGTSIRYSVSEVADRNVGVIAKISKKALAPLKREAPAK